MDTTRLASIAGKPRRAAALTLLVLALGACAADPAASPTAGSPTTPATASAEPTDVAPKALNQVVIPAPSLEGNLLGDPAERELWIYLPPQYFESEEALPVAYYLPGFGQRTVNGVTMPGRLDQVFETIDPMIVVVVPGDTSMGGSFYVDSIANGNWEQFITEEVVEYVDANFRTIPAAESRGLMGASMGGFGALNLGMRHPDVFGAVYATSPGVLNESGVAEMGFFDSEENIAEGLATLEAAGTAQGKDVVAALQTPNYVFGLSLAYGLAFSPATEPPYISYPFARTDGAITRDDAVWSVWNAGFGDWDLKVAEFKDNLLSLSAIGIDCPSDDEFAWISDGCPYLDAQLTAAGIDHEYQVTTGGHEDLTGKRIVEGMLPFMATHLVGGSDG